MNVKLLSFELSIRQTGRLGYAVVELPDYGIVVHNVAVRAKNGEPFALLPERANVRDGKHVPYPDGSLFGRCITFLNHDDVLAFSRAVVEAVIEASPEAKKAAAWPGPGETR